MSLSRMFLQAIRPPTRRFSAAIVLCAIAISIIQILVAITKMALHAAPWQPQHSSRLGRCRCTVLYCTANENFAQWTDGQPNQTKPNQTSRQEIDD